MRTLASLLGGAHEQCFLSSRGNTSKRPLSRSLGSEERLQRFPAPSVLILPLSHGSLFFISWSVFTARCLSLARGWLSFVPEIAASSLGLWARGCCESRFPFLKKKQTSQPCVKSKIYFSLYNFAHHKKKKEERMGGGGKQRTLLCQVLQSLSSMPVFAENPDLEHEHFWSANGPFRVGKMFAQHSSSSRDSSSQKRVILES